MKFWYIPCQAVWILWTQLENCLISFCFCVFSGGISFIVSGGMLLMSMISARNAPPPTGAPLPYQDPPPNYRNTWRQQFIDKIPAHLKEELEKDQPEIVRPKRHPRGSFTSASYNQAASQGRPQVFTISETPSGGQFSSGYSHRNLSSLPEVFGRTQRAHTAPAEINYDEGLPSYAEVQLWWPCSLIHPRCSRWGHQVIIVIIIHQAKLVISITSDFFIIFFHYTSSFCPPYHTQNFTTIV